MSRISVLSEDLANQIAAGEVVERPASVVKELLENSLDAGAKRIRVDIEGGGIGLLRVADDGSGMDAEDARMSVLRHATSKIARFDDLRALSSFGFRGEALPSIASVSRFELQTRRADSAEGTLVRLEGGGPPDVKPCGCAVGTVVVVRELFFNVPARRKFLKAVQTESAAVSEVVQALALCEPDVTLILAREGRVAREYLRAKSRQERARAAFLGEELAACRGERGPLSVEAYLSRPERARSGAGGLLMFVNGRFIRDRTLSRAVAMAYGSVLEPGRYPVGVVYIDLAAELVDVNVHPQKAEVRFADGRAVADAVYKIIAPELAVAFGLPEPDRSQWGKHKSGAEGKILKDQPVDEGGGGWLFSPAPLPPKEAMAEPKAAEIKADVKSGADAPSFAAYSEMPERQPFSKYPGTEAVVEVAPKAAAAVYPTVSELLAAPRTEKPAGSFSSLRFLAQVKGMFLLCEGRDGLYVIDQHAAAERVTFGKLSKAYRGKDVATQKLLFPLVFTVTPAEVALLEEATSEIERAGFDVRPMGNTQLGVHAVPKLLEKANAERLLRDLLAELGHLGGRAFSGAIDLALATMACHGSVRAGDAVTADEAKALLQALDEVDFAGHCPHGRPIVMRISFSELELRVGRR